MRMHAHLGKAEVDTCGTTEGCALPREADMSDIEPQVTAKEFHFKEYDSLKTEIAALVEHSRKIEIYVVGAVAAFYAWYVVNSHCYSFAAL